MTNPSERNRKLPAAKATIFFNVPQSSTPSTSSTYKRKDVANAVKRSDIQKPYLENIHHGIRSKKNMMNIPGFPLKLDNIKDSFKNFHKDIIKENVSHDS